MVCTLQKFRICCRYKEENPLAILWKNNLRDHVHPGTRNRVHSKDVPENSSYHASNNQTCIILHCFKSSFEKFIKWLSYMVSAWSRRGLTKNLYIVSKLSREIH